MLNKCHYTNEIVVFDMFTVILANIFDFFKTMTPLVEAVFVNETLQYFFHLVIFALFSYFTMLNFINDRQKTEGNNYASME